MAVTQGTNTPAPRPPPKPKPEPNPFEAIAQTISKTVQTTANTAVAAIEREVGSLIPADISVSLTTLGYSDPELRKAARLAAKMYDVSPQAFGIPTAKLKDYTDPITGGPLRASTFRRMMEGAEPAVFADMLQQAVVMSRPSRAHGGREGRQEPTADRTNAYFSTITRMFRDTDIDAQTAIGLAIALSEDASLSPRKIEQNLDAVKRWGAIHGESDWEVLFGLAAQAAKNGVTFREVSDVDRSLAPDLALAEVEELRLLEDQGYSRQQINAAISYERRRRRAEAEGRQLPPGDPATTAILALLPGMTTTGSGAIALDELAKRSTDAESYFARARELSREVVASKEAWQNSWLNRNVVTPALKALDPLNRAFEVGAITLQYAVQNPAGLTGPGQAGLQLGINVSRLRAGMEPYTIASGQALSEQYVEDVKDAWAGEIRMADTLVRDWGVSRFQAEAMEFSVGWGLDPLILAGKASRAFTLRKVAPDVLAATGKTGVTSRRLGNYIDHVDRFVTRNTDDLVKAMNTSDEAVISWTRKFRTVMGETPFDTTYLLRVREEMGKLDLSTAAGRRMAQENVDEALRVHLGGAPFRIGGPADVAYAARIAEANAAKKAWLGQIADGKAYNDYLVAQDRVLQMTPNMLPPGRLEVPKRNLPIPFAGSTKWVGAKYEDMFGDTLFGRNLAKLPNIDPGITLRVHENPQRWFKLQSRRAGLTDTEVIEWEAKAVRALATPVPEEALKKVLSSFHKTVWRKKTSAVGLSDDASEALFKEFEKSLDVSFDAERSFGAFNRGEPLPTTARAGGAARPVAQTQLVNELPAMDPVIMQRFINDTVGTIRRMRATFYRELKRSDPEWVKVHKTVGVDRWVMDHARTIGRAWIKVFKFTHVARPAYIARVVLGDELLRALATTQSAYEHGLAYGWHAAALRAVPDAPLRNAVGEKVATLGSRRVDDIVIDGPASVAREPLANTYLDQRDLLSDSMKSIRRRQAVLDSSGDWTELSPAAPNHIESWARALNLQLGKSPNLAYGLRLIADGSVTSQAGLRAAMLRHVQDGIGAKELKRIGREADPELWADEASDIVWSYSAFGQPDLARVALSGEVTDDMLRVYPKITTLDGTEVWGRPFVNGPRLARVSKGESTVDRWANRWYGMWVRGPENLLNRQPYYRTFYTRAKVAYTRLYTGSPVADDVLEEFVESWKHAPAQAAPPPPLRMPKGTYRSDGLSPAQSSAFDRFKAAGSEADEFIYHADQSTRLAQFRREGVIPRAPREAWEDGLSEPRVFFTDAPGTATGFGSKNNDMVLRVRQADVRTTPGRYEGEWFVGETVPASKWEYLGEDDQWHALANPPAAAPTRQITRTTRVVPGTKTELTPELQGLIDGAARKFALANSKKIMFDFTENSRIGEMLSFVFPFMQPWAENFFVWGHILTQRNPAMVGYVNRLAELGKQTGFIRKDPDTGEYVIPETWWAFSAPLLWLVAGRDAGVYTPLTSLNLFASSTIEVYGAPVPAPGMAPWGTYGLAQLFKDKTLPPWAAKYLFQFGPGAKDIPQLAQEAFLPRPAVTLLQAWAPDLFGEERLDNIAIEMLAAQQYNGQKPDPEAAKSQARYIMSYMAFTQLFFPGAVRIEYPHDWLNRAYEEKAEELGGGPDAYSKAREWFHETYPQYDAITIAKTINAKVSDYIDADGIEYLGGEVAPDAPRPPANAFYERLLKDPAFKEFATNPETAMWAAGLAAGYGSETANEFDVTAYFTQLNRGDIKQRSVLAAYESYEAGQFWEKWMPIDDIYDDALRYYEAQGLDENDEQVIKLRNERALTLEALANEFKIADTKYLVAREGGGMQFIYESGEQWPEGVHPAVLESAYRVAEAPETEDFPAFDGLRAYLKVRDDYKAKLQNQGLDGLEAIGAGELKARFEGEVQAILTENPAFKDTFYELWFRNDLGYGIVTKGREILNGWRDSDDEKLNQRYEDYTAFTTQYDRFSTRVADLEAAGAPQAEISATYQARTEFINDVYRRNPKFLDVWMKERSAGERKQFLEPTYARPVVFWSAWDWDEAAGVKLSKRGLTFLEKYQAEQTRIALWSEETDNIESSAEQRQALAAQAAKWAKQDETFAAAVDAMNTWGYGAVAKGYTEQGGRAGRAWTAILNFANDYRADAEAAEIYGDDPSVNFDRETRAWWNNGRDNVRNYLTVLKEWDPVFAQQWDDLTQYYDGSSMEWLFPRIHFAVGRVND